MTIFTPIFNTIDVSKYRCFLFDVSYPSMVATDVNTDIEHRCLCSMSHPYNQSFKAVNTAVAFSIWGVSDPPPLKFKNFPIFFF
jgi:hypothetical protein